MLVGGAATPGSLVGAVMLALALRKAKELGYRVDSPKFVHTAALCLLVERQPERVLANNCSLSGRSSDDVGLLLGAERKRRAKAQQVAAGGNPVASTAETDFGKMIEGMVRCHRLPDHMILYQTASPVTAAASLTTVESMSITPHAGCGQQGVPSGCAHSRRRHSVRGDRVLQLSGAACGGGRAVQWPVVCPFLKTLLRDVWVLANDPLDPGAGPNAPVRRRLCRWVDISYQWPRGASHRLSVNDFPMIDCADTLERDGLLPFAYLEPV